MDFWGNLFFMLNHLIQIFEQANKNLLSKDKELFEVQVSERTLCGALMLHIYDILKRTEYRDYNIDVEYNRNKGGKLKTISKTVKGTDEKIIKINCDLIVHSRGHNRFQDNLIAIEMKKSRRTQKDKEKDRERLIALTKDSFNDIWSYDGKTLPEHVCRYKLGVYYEIDFCNKTIVLEYYVRGCYYDGKRLDLT